ncbi:MAG: hypothetical protein V1841_01455 [Patescibacteria group bacterium]
MKYANIKKMIEAVRENQGFDVVVIVSSNGNSKYWQWRLSLTRKEILSSKTKIISTEEKWEEGGAGQLLGTLHSFQEASKIVNLKKILSEGGTVAFYHTAGYGKRIAPLCGTEGNNKPAIKLPKPIKVEEKDSLFTILEATLLSTQIYAKSRRGRICVFWGDQVIIPSEPVKIGIKMPVEMFGVRQKFNFASKEWRRHWKNYGILITKKDGSILQREKLSWRQVKKLQERENIVLDPKGRVELMKSMGCFSMDVALLNALLKEFYKELELKKRKLDTDEHLWMPLTSTKREYIDKGGSVIYWKRIKKFKTRFLKEGKKKMILGAKDLGGKTLWWDYGNLANYYKNNMILLENSEQGKAAREFYNLEKNLIKKGKNDLKIKNSIIINSEIEKGEVKNSIVINVKVKKIKAQKSILLYVKSKSINSKKSLIYNFDEEKGLKTIPNEVITDIFISQGTKIRMRTSLLRDSKEDWTIRLPQNPFSYSEVERSLSGLAAGSFRYRL